jgi:hypothetical protein
VKIAGGAQSCDPVNKVTFRDKVVEILPRGSVARAAPIRFNYTRARQQRCDEDQLFTFPA